MGPLPYPLPCQSNKESDSQQSQPTRLQSDSLSSTSPLSFLPSLSTAPSIGQSFHNDHQPSAATNHRCTSILGGHCSHVFSIALALAGKHLFRASSNGEISVWGRDPPSIDTYDDNVVVTGHSAVKSMVVLGDKLFTGHQDHKIRVWKIDHGAPQERYKCVAKLPTLADRFARLFSSANYVEVRRHKKCTWVHHVDAVSELAVSGDGSLLYSASWDRSFKVWRTSDFKCLQSIDKAHDDAINALALSPDGYIYTGSADKKIKVWKNHPEEKKHKLIATLEKHMSAVNALSLSADGSVLYSGACDRSIIVWERDVAGEMVVVDALRGHHKAILCLAVVGEVVCSGSADKMVRVWKRGDGGSYCCLAVLEHGGAVKCLAATFDGFGGSRISGSGSGTSCVVYSGGLYCGSKIWQVNLDSLETDSL
ncbi:hypothetical protein NMG60_11030728 [Bertholletia excelsa]